MLNLPHHRSKNGPTAIIAGFFGAAGLFCLALSFWGVSLLGDKPLPLWDRAAGVLLGVACLALSVRINLRVKDGE